MTITELGSLAEKIVIIATPFILIYIERKNARREKKEEAYRKLQKENRDLEKGIAENAQREQNVKINTLQTDVNTLKDDMNKVNKKMDSFTEEIATKITANLNDLLKLNNVNLAYCQSLSCLITTIGEGMRDQKMNGNLTEAIAKHQEKERELFASIFKSSC